MTIEFGVVTSPAYSYEQILRTWQEAERLGFDSAWVYDHFLGMNNLDDPYLEGWTLLTALLASTSRIRGGNLVLGNSYRHPAVLANMAATLDLLSGGRLDLGIGAGWYRAEYDAYGIPFPPISTRMEQLEEAIQVLRALWTEPRATFAGRHYQLTDAPSEPKPAQKPHPPIWVGGEGEKYLLRVVARQADGWNVWLLDDETYRHKVDVLAGYCGEAGRDPGSIRRSIGFALAVRPTEAEVAAEIERRGESREPRDLVSGTPDQVAGRLRGYAAMGVDTFLIEGKAVLDQEMLALFQSEVVPALRS